MTESTELEKIASDARAAAARCGAMVLNVVLSVEQLSIPVAHVSGTDFCALVTHIQPRIVYIFASHFDAKKYLNEYIDGYQNSDRIFKKLVAKWSKHDGEMFRVALGLIGDGVLHGLVENTDWIIDFEAEIDELLDSDRETAARDFEREQEAARIRAQKEEKKRLSPHIRKLLADPRFNGPKTSAAKREALAEMIFPDMDRATVRKIVEGAANQLWLNLSTS